MNTLDEHLNDISEVRSMMERSSKFLSLSGLSGISAGVTALAGSAVAYTRIQSDASDEFALTYFLVLDALGVLILALAASIVFTARAARKNNLPLWTNTTKYFLTDLAIPLIAGGFLCFSFWIRHLPLLFAPTTLVFYGLGLLNASKYTPREVRYLGISELSLGLLAFFWFDAELILWALGFGVLHIVYGVAAYRRYER